MNIGDYLKALEKIGVKFVSTSDIGELRKLYSKHVLPKPQRECFKTITLKNKRTSTNSNTLVCTATVKRIKFVRKDSVVKEVTTSAKKRPSTETAVIANKCMILDKKSNVSVQGDSSVTTSVDHKAIKPNSKRVQFSEDVTESIYVPPKFKKTAVSWP